MEKRELVYYRLDKIDGKILDILQGNARASLKEIASYIRLTSIKALRLEQGFEQKSHSLAITITLTNSFSRCCRLMGRNAWNPRYCRYRDEVEEKSG